MSARGETQLVTEYAVETAHSKTILMVTDDLNEAHEMLALVEAGHLLTRTIRYGSWEPVPAALPIGA